MTTPIVPPMKRCSKCGEEFPATTEFWHKHKPSEYGLNTRCKTCKLQDVKESQKRNPDTVRNYLTINRERRRVYAKEHRRKNHQACLEYSRQYYVENRLYWREWKRNNVESVTASGARRRARKLALPNTLTKEETAMAYDYFNNTCAICCNQLRDLFSMTEPHLDHWIPLSDLRPDNPGTVAANMLPMCSTCNISKKNNDPVEWLNKKIGKRKAKPILERIQVYFEWVKHR